jgi:hypothetical protein
LLTDLDLFKSRITQTKNAFFSFWHCGSHSEMYQFKAISPASRSARVFCVFMKFGNDVAISFENVYGRVDTLPVEA